MTSKSQRVEVITSCFKKLVQALYLNGMITLLLKNKLSVARPPDKSVELKSYFSTKTYVVGTQKNRLNEGALLSTQNARLN